MQFLKKVFVSGMILSTLIFLSPHAAHAQSADCPYPGCFSGYSLPFMYKCTCNPYYSYMVFFPFNSNGTTFVAAMSVPAAVSYSTYITSPAQKYVGTYVPGVQSCEIYAVYGCFTLPSYGTVLEMTGVSPQGPFY